jgi:transcriptional regulator
LKDAIQASITCQFEQEVIELRSLGFTDDEISVMLSCSRSGVSAAKRAVRARFDEVMRDE